MKADVNILSTAQKRLRGVARKNIAAKAISPWPAEIAWRIERHRLFGDYEHNAKMRGPYVPYVFPLSVLPFDKVSDEDLVLCELITLSKHSNEFLDTVDVVGNIDAEHTAYLFLSELDKFADFTRVKNEHH